MRSSVLGSEIVLLVGHGSRSELWFESIDACREVVKRALEPTRVEIAYLDHHPARFREVLRTLLTETKRIAIVPLLMAPGGHFLKDIGDHLAELMAEEPSLKLRLLPTLTEFDEVKSALASAVLSKLSA
tara:strand:+ start:96 stop:482 length:387 start_codon:yes stop_codon:yes gene_type:complete